jgi:hypothetical protein
MLTIRIRAPAGWQVFEPEFDAFVAFFEFSINS